MKIREALASAFPLALALAAVPACGPGFESVHPKPKGVSQEVVARDQACPNPLKLEAPGWAEIPASQLLDHVDGRYRLEKLQFYAASQTRRGKKASGIYIVADQEPGSSHAKCSYVSKDYGLEGKWAFVAHFDRQTGLAQDAWNLQYKNGPDATHTLTQVSAVDYFEGRMVDPDRENLTYRTYRRPEGGISVRQLLKMMTREGSEVRILAVADYSEIPFPQYENRAIDFFSRLTVPLGSRLYQDDEVRRQADRLGQKRVALESYVPAYFYFRRLKDEQTKADLFPGRRAIEMAFACMSAPGFDLRNFQRKLTENSKTHRCLDALKQTLRDLQLDVPVDQIIRDFD